MPKDSIQKKLGRVRPPRVHITYDVETGGAMAARELPFVVGVMADLGGESGRSVNLKERRFTEINPDNFDKVMGQIKPKVTVKVPNTIQGKKTETVSFPLVFERLDDFEPQNVASKIEAFQEILKERKDLANLLASLPGNAKLAGLLEQVLTNTELRQQLAAELASSEPKKEK